jgi:hypothetical protein
MIKVTIGGEVYSFDNEHYPLAEAIELERGLGVPFGVWRAGLSSGSALSVAGFAWLVLKRGGRDVPLADIMSGKFPLNDDDITVELEGGDDAEGPTRPGSQPGEMSGSGPSPSSTAPPSSES